MIRRVVRYLAVVLLSLAVILGGLVAFLVLTSPEPRPAEGWVRLADMPDPRGEVAMAILETSAGSRLYVLGGIRGIDNSARVTVYDPGADTWSEGPDIPAARNHAAAAVLDGTIYLSGGYPTIILNTPSTNFWALEPGSNVWKELAPIPEGRAGHGMVALGGKLYVVGGDGTSDSVLVYDPGSGWTTGAAIPASRHHLVVIVFENEIWVIGGRSGFAELMDRVDIYDPRVDLWRIGPSLPEPMSAMAAGVLSTGIHIVGGEDPSLFGKVLDRHYRLTPGIQTWELAPHPIAAVHGVPGAVIEDRLIIAGGATRQGVLSVLAWTGVTQSYPDR